MNECEQDDHHVVNNIPVYLPMMSLYLPTQTSINMSIHTHRHSYMQAYEHTFSHFCLQK